MTEEIAGEATEREELKRCSFCGKSEHDVLCLVAAAPSFICSECVQISADIVLKHLWDKATRLQETIRGMEKHGGIPAIEGVSDQKIPSTEGEIAEANHAASLSTVETEG